MRFSCAGLVLASRALWELSLVLCLVWSFCTQILTVFCFGARCRRRGPLVSHGFLITALYATHPDEACLGPALRGEVGGEPMSFKSLHKSTAGGMLQCKHVLSRTLCFGRYPNAWWAFGPGGFATNKKEKEKEKKKKEE